MGETTKHHNKSGVTSRLSRPGFPSYPALRVGYKVSTLFTGSAFSHRVFKRFNCSRARRRLKVFPRFQLVSHFQPIWLSYDWCPVIDFISSSDWLTAFLTLAMIGRSVFTGYSFSESLENSKIHFIYIKKSRFSVNITNSLKLLVVKRESCLIVIILAYLLDKYLKPNYMCFIDLLAVPSLVLLPWSTPSRTQQ